MPSIQLSGTVSDLPSRLSRNPSSFLPRLPTLCSMTLRISIRVPRLNVACDKLSTPSAWMAAQPRFKSARACERAFTKLGV